MADDGEIAVTYGALQDSQRFNFSFQALPWLETTFRYSRIGGLHDVSNCAKTSCALYDRSIGIKIRLWQESEWRPDISIGVRDLIGTNFYGAEYLVATKTIFETLDLTGGIGWGRLGQFASFSNPFGWINPALKTRAPPSGSGGQLDFGQFFHGSAGLFGGAIWRTPIPNLDLLIEASGDNYQAEAASGHFNRRSPVNFGLAYRPLNDVLLSAGWLYGSTVGATLTLTLDPKHSLAPAKLDTPPPTVVIRPADTRVLPSEPMPEGPPTAAAPQPVQSTAQWQPDMSNLQETIWGAACDQRLAVQSIAASGREMTVYYVNNLYFQEAEAAGRLARILMAKAPGGVETFKLVALVNDVPQREFVIPRSALEHLPPLDAGAILAESVVLDMPPLESVAGFRRVAQCAAANTSPLGNALGSEEQPIHTTTSTPYAWSILPAWQVSLFDPLRPLQYRVFVAASGSVRLLPGLTASGTFDVNVYNDFRCTRAGQAALGSSKIATICSGQQCDVDFDSGDCKIIPGDVAHVRSAISEYLSHGANGIASLALTYRTRLAPDVFGEAKAGYLESMYAGAGGQLLWRPDESRLALGADIYYVRQRGTERLLNLRTYDVVTGHVSAYYRSPWYGLNFNVHAGRYLAKDWGGTLEITRRFFSGVEVGAFATLTTVPFSKFGEGSFDKGILVSIPLEWGLPFHSTSVFEFPLHSLTRDGGQRLQGDDSLYDETRRTGYYEIEEHLDDMANP